MSLGTIVVDEVVLDIQRVWLAGGKLRIEANTFGLVEIRSPSEYRVHGPDGALIYTSIWPADIGTVTGRTPADEIRVTLDIDMKPWGREALDRFYAGARP